VRQLIASINRGDPCERLRLVYLPPRNENGQKFPASIELRLPGTNGDDVVAASGPVECEGCASPFLKEVQKTKDKVNVSVKVKLSSPPEVGVEIDFGKTDSGRRVLVHAKAALTPLAVGDRGLVAYKAQGKGIINNSSTTTARLTTADAARAVVIDYAQQKWLGNSFVATQPEQARAFILRHLTEGDTYDFVSFTRLVLDDGKSFADGSQPALLGVGYLNLPAIGPEVASCDTCGRETFRDFVVSAVESRKSEGGYLPLPIRDKDPGRRAIGCDDCFVGIPSLPQPLTGSPITGLGITSRCIFPDENCDSYDVPVGIGDRAFAITIKTKSPRY
jgi:hypothetical protein